MIKNSTSLKTLLYSTLVAVFWIATTGTIMAQQKVVVVTGQVIDRTTDKPLHQANIAVDNTTSGTTSGRTGYYRIRVKKRTSFRISFSYVGYQTYVHRITPNMLSDKPVDTILLNVPLVPEAFEIGSVDIRATRPEPDTVFGTYRYHVEDFEFLDDEKLVFLTRKKRLDKQGRVVIANSDQEELASVTVPGHAMELFRDFQGNVNVETEDAMFRIQVEDENVFLQQMPKEDFDQMIRPVEDTLNRSLLYSNFTDLFPEFRYFVFSPEDSTVREFKHVIDKELAHLFWMQYYFLEPKQKLAARKLAMELNMDKRDVAAIMIDFQNSIYFDPLFAPLFVVNDTIMIFDHYEDKLYKYDRSANAIDSIKITHHKDVRRIEWRREMHRDDLNDNIYAVFKQKGYSVLKRLDHHTGKVAGTFRLYHKYVEKIRVRDDYAYYLYRPNHTLQNKFLYRELIREE